MLTYLFNVPTSSSFRPQLERFEPIDIFSVEEHVPHRDQLLVDLVWMSSQNDAFGYHTTRRWREAGSCCDEVQAPTRGCRWLEEKSGNRAPSQGGDERSDGRLTGM